MIMFAIFESIVASRSNVFLGSIWGLPVFSSSAKMKFSVKYGAPPRPPQCFDI